MVIRLGARPARRTRVLVSPPAVACLVGLFVYGMGSTLTSTAPVPAETYRWHGELVALDAERRLLTVSARLVATEALADLASVAPGDAIELVWSGFEQRTDGVRAVYRQGAAPEAPYRLAATWVAADAAQRRVTFRVPITARQVTTLRSLSRGEWVTVASPLAPTRRTAAVVTLAAFDHARRTVPSGEPTGTYAWSGELVALDEPAGTVTVDARLVSPALTETAARLTPGEAIIIRWSGYRTRANGIRALAVDDGLWGGDRFLLPATFVAATDQRVRFTVTPPAESLSFVRTQARGDWATFTSPHRPAGTTDAVVGLTAYAASPTPATPPPTGRYHWDAELVALDEPAGTVTVRSRLVTPAARAAVEDLDPGDAIVITWSGYQDRTHGIRRVAPFDESGLWGGDRFLLPATFVAATDQVLTFTVTPPAPSLATVRVQSRGDWATFTSPHRPAGPTDAVVGLTAYAAPAQPAPLLPAPTDTYRWHAELVALDDHTGTVTVQSRVVARDALTAVEAVAPGDAILITWSGYKTRADGIRRVTPFDQSGLWGGDRFLLPATFVAATDQRLTFTVTPPAESLPLVRAQAQGDWATFTSPHHPSGPTDAVVGLTAYAAPSQPAPTLALPTGTYQWNAELVALDEAAGALTVKAPVVSDETRTDAARLRAGDPIVIIWSGYQDRTDGIRHLRPFTQSGLWGGTGFLLPATFEQLDGDTVTFTVTPPASSLALIRGLTPGEWTTVTSPHRPAGAGDAVVTLDAYDPSRRARRYVWPGTLAELDRQTAVAAVTVAVEPHVVRYLDRFEAGDEVVLVWAPGADNRVTAIRYLEFREQSTLDHGYILPVTFVAADAAAQQITFTTTVPPHTLGLQAALEPGHSIQVTSPFAQSGETAAILTVEPAQPR